MKDGKNAEGVTAQTGVEAPPANESANDEPRMFTQEDMDRAVQKAKAKAKRSVKREINEKSATPPPAAPGETAGLDDVMLTLGKLAESQSAIAARFDQLETKDKRSAFQAAASQMGVNEKVASDLTESFLASGETAADWLGERGYKVKDSEHSLPKQTPSPDGGGPASPRDPAQIDLTEMTKSDAARLAQSGKLREVVESSHHANSQRLPHLFKRSTPQRE